MLSPSFSNNAALRGELEAAFSDVSYRAGEPLVAFLNDADAAIVGLERIDEAVLSELPGLKLVSKYGVGLDNLDQEALKRHGVALGWTPGVNRRSVAELALCAMLGLCRNVFRSSFLLKQGTWEKRGGRELSSTTVGIVGMGNVGRDLATLLAPFGCRILANDIVDVTEFCLPRGIAIVEKPRLFAESDIVTLHVPLTAETRRLIDAKVLASMKPGSILVNTARGGIVDEKALLEALVSGHLSGAALDVFEVEPPTDHALSSHPSFVPTPHIGGSSREAQLAMGRSAIHHLREFFGV